MIAPSTLLTRADCAYAIAGHAAVAPADIFRAAAERYETGDRDIYGSGASLNAFEGRIAALLGKEAAAFMPSGTMAQQIALRIVADRSGVRSFAAHPTTHVVIHERDGFARLHDLRFVSLGSAVTALTVEQISAVREPIGTLLVELPQREIGGELPTWDELVEMVGVARSRGWHVHLDGARLWECGPYYARPYAEITALFESVYVSFYKGIGALAGAMLLGSRAFVDEAAIWQRRHGGNLYTLFPYAAIAEQAFDDRIQRMPAYVQAAQRVARALERFPNVRLRPNPPRTNMLHAFLSGDAAQLAERAQRVARDHGVWTIGRLAPTASPSVHAWEISCGDATLALSDSMLEGALAALLAD